MATAIEQRIFRECIPHPDDFLHEIGPESRLTGFIPSGGFGHVRFYFRTEFHPSRHFVKRERRRAFISSSGTAEAGSRL